MQITLIKLLIMLSFQTGTLIFVKGDKVDEWWLALDWQAREFLKVMQFGKMKSMGGCIIPTEYTAPFREGPFEYRFVIEDGWGPCFLENLSTGKKRSIRYFHLGNETHEKIFRNCNVKINK